MAESPWQRRINRAQELMARHPFAAQILGFYIHLSRFQEDLHRSLTATLQPPPPSLGRELTSTELTELTSRFEPFLSLAKTYGPPQLAELSRELRARGTSFWSDLLNSTWTAPSTSGGQHLAALAYLQPYAELQRLRGFRRSDHNTPPFCPLCGHKPGFGLLRQAGEGAARSLVCSFCLSEWDFRRIVCPACGEEREQQLPVFTASDFDYIRVECCDTCKTYLKGIDLTKNGRAEPVVDELASAPLDLWARDRGYTKLQQNLLGM